MVAVCKIILNGLSQELKKRELKSFKNCINPPIFHTDDEKLIIDIILPPELHLLLGVVNTLFEHMARENEEDALKWASLCHVKRQKTHGSEEFNGNACRILLEHTDFLRSSLTCLKYVEVLKNFRDVVKGCFTNDLQENYLAKIEKFKRSYLDLEIPVTPKVHAVFHHVPYFCKKYGHGLGSYSEQAVEAVHHDFQPTWLSFKVLKESPMHDTQLLRAVCKYNASHV